MRDPSRIEPFLSKLGEVWERHPDLRFGQLCSWLEYGRVLSEKDPFFAEESDWIEAMDSVLEETAT